MPFLTVNNHQLHYADSHPDGAPANGSTIIFIHGLGSSQNYYFPILPSLTPNHRCITLDTYGAARSPYTEQPVSIASIAADVIAVLDTLQIPQAVAVGHSMGGLVVTLLGAQYASRIKGVVAIGPTHPSEALASGMRKRQEIVSSSSSMEQMANTIPTAATGSQCPPLVRAFIRELLLTQNSRGYAALCGAIADSPVIDYAAVKAPFLLIAGEEDKAASMEGCRTILEGVGSAQKKIEVLNGVGHWHVVEEPGVVGGLIGGFVGGL